MNEAQKAKSMSDKALQEAERAKKDAKTYYENAERARQQARQEEEERRKAENKARSAVNASIQSKMTYKSLFMGNMIFTLVLAFFVAYGKRGVLQEMGKWFPARWHDLVGVFKGLQSLFMALAKFPPAKWGIGAIWGYVFAVVVSLALLVGLFFLLRWVKEKIGGLWWNIKLQYHDGTFKAIVSADIALAMLYVCLFFYESLKKLLPLNILSIWLILSFVGVMIWNAKEIIGGATKA